MIQSQYLRRLPVFGTPRFAPSDISGLALWLDGADASTMTIGGSNKVSQWNDKSGNGRNLTQGNTNLQPAYVTNVLNGLSAVQPDGVDDTIQGAVQAASAWYGSGTPQITWVYLLSYISTGWLSLGLTKSLFDTTDRFLIERRPPADGTRDFLGQTTTQTIALNDAPYPGANAWSIATVRWTSGSAFTLRRTTSSGTATYNSTATLTGSMSDLQRPIVGYGTNIPAQFNLAEWMIYNRNLADSEVAQIESYLLGKWGTI